MNFINNFLPFILSFVGVISDYITTSIGLNLKFHETNSSYHPLKALLFFWCIIFVLIQFLPKDRISKITIKAVVLISYFGAINNILVILGLFHGLTI